MLMNNIFELKYIIENCRYPGNIMNLKFCCLKFMYEPFLLFQGKLMLTNTEDGTEHVFHLSGKAEKPLALEHIVLKTRVRER